MSSGVVLVCAPFASVVRPALGLSTLCSALEREGIAADVRYENLRFAAQVGIEIAERIACDVPTHYLIGEWFFARSAFGARDDAEYLARVASYVPGGQERMFAVREIAEAFVEESAGAIASAAPRVVGFSTTFQQNAASLAIAARVRALAPQTTICFGGANCEGPMGRALLRNYAQIDAVFSGESDETFPEFVRRLYAGEPLSSSGTVSLRGEPVRTDEVVRPIMDLDTLPIPDFDDYFNALDAYALRDCIVPALSIEASRGCWWGERKHCRFCGLNGSSMTYRAKSGSRVLNEIESLASRYGISRFMLSDNILQLDHVATVFDDLAERDTPYRFFCEIKANMTADQLRRLAKGGVTSVQPGIESLDDELLRSMEKGVSALHNIRLLRVCTELGMAVSWNLLVGIPDESDEAYRRMRKRISLIEHLGPPSGCSPIRIDRFSPYFDRSEELGFTDVRPAWAYDRIYDLPDRELRELAYFFDGEPRNASSFAHIESLRSTIELWRGLHHATDGAPVLAILDLDPLIVVRDTRSCAEMELRLLSPAEACMVRLFRDVAPVDRALAVFSELHADDDAQAVLARLNAWKYLMIDGNRALSLVTDFETRVFEANEVMESLGRIVVPEALVS